MNDADIIKALEEELKTALIINHRFEESNDTENPDDHKFIALLINTIDLIKRQKAEIEKLKDDNQYLEDRRWKELCEVRAETIEDVLLQLEAEIESSEKYIREYDDGPLQKAYNQGLRAAYNAAKGMIE